jgi:hypothetical protein
LHRKALHPLASEAGTMRTGKKMPAGNWHSTAGGTDTRIVGAGQAPGKEFATLQARAALVGHALHQIITADGETRYLASRWGLTRELPTIEDVRQFVEQIGG